MFITYTKQSIIKPTACEIKKVNEGWQYFKSSPSLIQLFSIFPYRIIAMPLDFYNVKIHA